MWLTLFEKLDASLNYFMLFMRATIWSISMVINMSPS
jgi:hypothetical protein